MPKRRHDPFSKANSVTFTLVPRSLTEQTDTNDTNQPKYNLQLKHDTNSRGRTTVIDESNYTEYLPADFPTDLIVDDTDEYNSYNNTYSKYIQQRIAIDHESNDNSRLPYEYNYTYHMKPITTNDSIYIDKTGKLYDTKPVNITDIPETVPESEIFGTELNEINTDTIHTIQRLQQQRSQQHINAKLYKDFMLSLDEDALSEYEFEEPDDTFVADAMGNNNDENIEIDLCDNENEIVQNDTGGGIEYEYESEYEEYSDDEKYDYSDTESQYTTQHTHNRTIDTAFDQLLRSEYNEDDIGELDPELYGDTLDGRAETSEFNDIIQQYATQHEQNYENDGNIVEVLDTTVKQVTADRLKKWGTEPDESVDDVMSQVDSMYTKAPPPEFDAESVISTYSNIENHPTVISEPRRIRTVKTNTNVAIQLDKRGMPIHNNTLTQKLQHMTIHETDEYSDHDTQSQYTDINNSGAPRDKFETAEQKKQRKHAAKELKRHQREQKSVMKSMYKTVKQTSEKQQANQMKLNVGALIKL